MSRRSTRLQSKRERDHHNDLTELEENQSKKRKTVVEDSSHESDVAITVRRKQFQSQNQFVPISSASSIITTTEVAGCLLSSNGLASCRDHVTPRELFLSQPANRFFSLASSSYATQRDSPLPNFEWADSHEVWQVMMEKETMYTRDPYVLDRHPMLQPRMRSILVDWLSEVCEVYKLHRETLHLAVDFVDRYLSATRDIKKDCLQLLGISALFIAAKLEEIYPPKLGDFAYVTDGACKESEILEQEMLLLRVLKWDLSPMTTNSWLNVFLQLAENMDHDAFVVPQYSAHNFVQLARLVDLCMLDIGSLQFSYSVLAAAALYHEASEYVAYTVSGYKWHDISACVQWMAPFVATLCQYGSAELKQFANIKASYVHNIQTHSVDMKLLDKVHARQAELAMTSSRHSPDLSREFPGLITPPHSVKVNKMSHMRKSL